MFRLDSKTAFITGAGPGIGAAIAQLFALQGAADVDRLHAVNVRVTLDHSHTGVRFNAICPGRVQTPFVKARLAEYPDPAQTRREMASTQLNGRMARSDEVAAAALYVAADESAMVTGSNLLLDGGWGTGK